MLYISRDKSALQLEEGAYLHVYNPALSDAPEGSLVLRELGRHTKTLEHIFRDGSHLIVSVDSNKTITVDLLFNRDNVFVTVFHTVTPQQYVLPSDPVVHVLQARDRVMIPLMEGDADAIHVDFFDTAFLPVAVVSYDSARSIIHLDTLSFRPFVTMRLGFFGTDSFVERLMKTLEQAGVKVVIAEI